MFNITFNESYIDDEFGQYVLSKIEIDDFKEYMRIPIDYWGVSDYKSSWKKNIEEGMLKNSCSAIIVSMQDESSLNFIEVWVLYFQNDEKVYIQNKIVFCDDHDDFNVENLNIYVKERILFTEDGDKVSEWVTNKESVIEFYNSL